VSGAFTPHARLYGAMIFVSAAVRMAAGTSERLTEGWSDRQQQSGPQFDHDNVARRVVVLADDE
jgi:hypothetical protein